jgi:hypothetical protein
MKATSYAYYLDGSMKTLTYPSGRAITYTIEGAGRPLSAVDSKGSAGLAFQALRLFEVFCLLRRNRRRRRALIWKARNEMEGPQDYKSNPGLQWKFNYSRLQPATTQASWANGTVLNLAYNFNLGTLDNGNVASITNNRDATAPPQRPARLPDGQRGPLSRAPNRAKRSRCWSSVRTFLERAAFRAFTAPCCAQRGSAEFRSPETLRLFF